MTSAVSGNSCKSIGLCVGGLIVYCNANLRKILSAHKSHVRGTSLFTVGIHRYSAMHLAYWDWFSVILPLSAMRSVVSRVSHIIPMFHEAYRLLLYAFLTVGAHAKEQDATHVPSWIKVRMSLAT